jgi:hypothetical protein
MKCFSQHTFKFCLTLVTAVIFSACSSGSDSDNGNGNDDPPPSDFPFEAIMNEEVSFLALSIEAYGDDFEAYFMMYIKEDHESVTVAIDGNEVEMDSFLNYYFAEVDLVPGQNVAYEVVVDGSAREGDLEVPELLQAEFPESFDLSADFTVSWSINSDPSLFIAHLDIELEDDWVESGNVLQGNSRSHTFSSELYAGLSEEDIWYIDTGIAAIDYKHENDMVFLATTDAYHEYSFNSQFISKMREGIQGAGSEVSFPSFLRKR